MMRHEVGWILGDQDKARVLNREEFLADLSLDRNVYGGFLWADLDLDKLVRDFHSRLLLDFRSGWTGVGFSSRGETPLGPWSAPTSARAHPSAPFGLYLLSGDRLIRSLPEESENLERAIHKAQRNLGPIFCDPKLEVRLTGRRDFEYSPPSLVRRLWWVLRYLWGGEH